VHDSQTLKDGSFFSRIFCISPKWVESLTGKAGFSNVNTFNGSFVNDSHLFQKLLFLHRVLLDSNSSQLGRECAPIELFSDLFCRYSNGNIETGKYLGTKSILVLKDYIMTNLHEKIYLEDLARLCDLSKPQFLRHFKKSMGLTPYNWLLLLRLGRAMEMLKSGKRSTEVAYLVGFYDQPHFINAFQRTYGLKPAEVQRSRVRY
jgi:AraC-like DNA-binding protein